MACKEIEALASWRVAAGLSQSYLAEKLGVAQQTVNEFETQNDFKMSTYKRYAEAIGVEVHVVLHAPRPTWSEEYND